MAEIMFEMAVEVGGARTQKKFQGGMIQREVSWPNVPRRGDVISLPFLGV